MSAPSFESRMLPCLPSEHGVGLAQNGCKLAHAVLWEYSYERLKSAQYLGRHGVVLT
jgi:hypothetical protein